jgi:hypothetical protein
MYLNFYLIINTYYFYLLLLFNFKIGFFLYVFFSMEMLDVCKYFENYKTRFKVYEFSDKILLANFDMDKNKLKQLRAKFTFAL